MPQPRDVFPLTYDSPNTGDWQLVRAGFRWLVPDGGPCLAGQPIAFANVACARNGEHWSRNEFRDFQVAFIPRVSGQVTWRRDLFGSGWDTRLAQEIDFGDAEPIGDIHPSIMSENPGHLRLLWLAGRRAVEVGEARGGLLSGWHERVRGWWGEGEAPTETLLSIGTCVLGGLVLGDRRAFIELFGECPGPAHVVSYPDDVIVPSSAVLLQGLERTPAEVAQIAADVGSWMRSVSSDGVMEDGRWSLAQDMFFVTQTLALLSRRSSVLDTYPIVGEGGVHILGPARTVVLSVDAEIAYHLRHKTLGYVIAVHTFRFPDMSPVLKHRLKTEFERLVRSPEDVERDLTALIDRITTATGAKIVLVNSIASHAFNRPRSEHSGLGPLALNVVLADIAKKRPIAVVDVDAVAVDMGIKKHARDGIHMNGELEHEARRELVRTLRALGMRGF
jgi:hypothetical protein